MYKEILFVEEGTEEKKVLKTDLSKLGYEAMSMADKITTTDNKDSDSQVLLCCKYINSELYKRIIADNEGNYTEDQKRSARFTLNCIEGGSFDCEMPFGEMVRTAFHMWTPIKSGEGPEEYFERQVREFREKDRDMVLAEPMVPMKYQRIKNDMDTESLARAAGVSEEIITMIESGRSRLADLSAEETSSIAAALGIAPDDLEIPYENTEYLVRTKAF